MKRFQWLYGALLVISLIFHVLKLSMENVTDKLKMANAKPEIIEQFIDTLNSCEFARFAPGDPSDNMKQIYDKAAVIIIQIEKELR